MYIKDNRGLTLLEVLASTVILAIISIILWSIFFQSTDFSKKAVSKNQLQQEANVIIASLNSIHKRSTEYSVKIDSCDFSVEYTVSGITKTEKFDNDKMCIKLSNSFSNSVIPKTNKKIALYLIIEEISNPGNSVHIDVLLNRL